LEQLVRQEKQTLKHHTSFIHSWVGNTAVMVVVVVHLISLLQM